MKKHTAIIISNFLYMSGFFLKDKRWGRTQIHQLHKCTGIKYVRIINQSIKQVIIRKRNVSINKNSFIKRNK